jgi:hypothetical protein
MKGTTMTQNQHDNKMLHLEWETKFMALTVVTELNHKNRTK